MKSLSIILLVLVSTFSFGQSKTVKKETVKVWGNCGMCKKTIESAAKSAGASQASWDSETKELQLSFASAKTSSDKIQQAIAASGYDTEKFTADNKAYDNLHECCQYERKAASSDLTKVSKKDCCSEGNCKDNCCKDGKCQDGKCKDGAACEKNASECCQDKSAGSGKACCKKQ
jgi:mercuric ion binding protein